MRYDGLYVLQLYPKKKQTEKTYNKIKCEYKEICCEKRNVEVNKGNKESRKEM